jgi:hypothetical protein
MKRNYLILTLFLLVSIELTNTNHHILFGCINKNREVDTYNPPKYYNTVYKSFKNFNPYVDSLSAIVVSNVINEYSLANNTESLKWLIGQILLESGAKQYYQPTHPKEGQLVLSSAGAVGFTQILPSTALGYLTKKLSDDDKIIFNELGATDFSFINNSKLSHSDKISMTRTWLENETNNIIMWGKIMSSKLKTKTLIEALVSYNAGDGGLRRFISNGNDVNKHRYILGIRERIEYVII